MEQTLSFPYFGPSCSNKPSNGTRKIWRKTSSPISQVFPVETCPAPVTSSSSSSFALDDPFHSKSLGSAKQRHARILKTAELWSSMYAVDSLIQEYWKSRDLRSAAAVFLVALQSGTLSWGYLIDTFHNRDRNSRDLLRVLRELHRMGAMFSVEVLSKALGSCAQVADLWLGLQMHAYLTKAGLDNENYIRCSLLDLYAHCCGLESSAKLFKESSMEGSVLWNKFIVLNVDRGRWYEALDLFQKMQSVGLEADELTLAKVLHACGRLEAVEQGKAIHGHVIRSGIHEYESVSNSLISMYSKNSQVKLARRVFEYIGGRSLVSWNSIISCCSLNGFLEDALELFHDMLVFGVNPDSITWNSLISGYSRHGSPHQVFEFFQRMQNAGLKPASRSITSVLRPIADSGLVEFGKQIHGYVIRHGLESNVYVGTALTDAYAKCRNLANARRLFDSMPHRNVLTWSSMLSGYAYEGLLNEALELLKQMEEEGQQPNLATWTSLISGYSIQGLSSQALLFIRQMKTNGVEPNVVSWTAVISGCCRNGQFEDAIHVFREMQDDGIQPNSVTVVTLLRACAALAYLKKGRELHCFATRKGLDGNIIVATALIDMYAKAGSLSSAHLVFNKLEHKNLASWNAMIMCFAAHGHGGDAISLFDQMCETGIEPNGISFVAVLSGCRHGGLLDEGWKYFDSMTGYNVTPTLEHYTCMVDLLARCGYIDEAWDFIQKMPLEPDAGIWGSLLAACRTHGNVELAEVAAMKLIVLEPYNSANYLMMRSTYARKNRWEDAENMKDAMNAAGVKKRTGWSWIEIDQTVHVFEIEGTSHPEIGDIYFELYRLISKMRRLGYVPDTRCILQNIREEEKEKLLLSHTEKLAMTYGLISTDEGTPIRVIKNTRVCNDCHLVAKYMSQISGREIFLRDGSRFHHFKDGRCSCNDFW